MIGRGRRALAAFFAAPLLPAILVQTGDVVDRGPDSLMILRQLMQLQRDAPPAGGRGVALVGNREAMNVIGVDPGEYAAFADRISERPFPALVATGGLGQFAGRSKAGRPLSG